MRPLILAGVLAVAVSAGATIRSASGCDACMVARFWKIDPNLYKTTALEKFPETDALEKMRPDDLAIAFSGGGTRSAAASLGELRGLRDTGWLDRVRYVSAVSGGSWAALPYVYSPLGLEELLGAPEAPGDLSLQTLDKHTTARGRLGEAIVKSSLLPGASIEVGDRVSRNKLQGEYQKLAKLAFGRLKGPDGGRDDKTYSRLLDRVFIKPLVSDPLARGSSAPPLFDWTDDTVADIATLNVALRGVAPINPVRFAVAAKNRPFLIALGTVVIKDPASGYPRLVPVEYTPLYAGVRQQFGDTVGGAYVSPFAYDAAQAVFERDEPAETPPRGVVAIGPAGATSTFSLADVIASSGAAPQLHLLVDTVHEKVDPMLREFALFFPHYRNVAVRLGGENRAGSTEALAHGDGGFVDNLGLMPLLARHSRNVIVFVNGLMSHRLETQLPSFFWSTGIPDGNGTRRINAVFGQEHWKELMEGLDRAVATGEPQVYCSDPETPWEVRANEFYNVQPYTGLNICWVYNADSNAPSGAAGESQWRKALKPDVRTALFGDPAKKIKGQYDGDFKRFPWYRTFGENPTGVIYLKPRQVNVLANFTSWMVTDRQTQQKFARTFSKIGARR